MLCVRPIGYRDRMEKQLIVVGNSLALVIEKSLRALLGITYKTRLNVTTDGVRLIVEPIGTEPVRAVSSGRGAPLHVRRINALRVYDALEALGLDNEKFIRLTGSRIWAYRPRLDVGKGDASLVVAMDRLDVCIDVLNAGGSWEQAIEAALSAVPQVTSGEEQSKVPIAIPAAPIAGSNDQRRRLAANGRDDLGEAGPVAIGDGPFGVAEGGGERGVAVDGDAVAAGEADELGGAGSTADGEACGNGSAERIPADRDREVVAEEDEGGGACGGLERRRACERGTVARPARIGGGEAIVVALVGGGHGERARQLEVAGERVEDAEGKPRGRERGEERHAEGGGGGEHGGGRELDEAGEPRGGEPQPAERDGADHDGGREVAGGTAGACRGVAIERGCAGDVPAR